ncbi:MAG: hypothetical protein LBM17_05165 [Candidatus Accumulibacter sp.]|jgi:hypothetical protein|nr:hypothetical protein [Accumulibacter sp.]
MPLVFFNAEKLARKLRRNEVGNKERYCYLAAGSLATILFMYSGFFPFNTKWSMLKALEFSCALGINLIGFCAIFTLLKEETTERLVSDFICLSFPVVNTLYAVVWGFFWLVNEFLSNKTINLAYFIFGYRVNYVVAVNPRYWFFASTAFLSNTILQIAFFFWIFRLLKKAKRPLDPLDS